MFLFFLFLFLSLSLPLLNSLLFSTLFSLLLSSLVFSCLLLRISPLFLFSMTMTVITGSERSLCALSARVHGPGERHARYNCLGIHLCATRAIFNEVGLNLRWRWRGVHLR